MTRVNYTNYKEDLILYVVNVYQPCTAGGLLEILRDSAIDAFSEIGKIELDGILSKLQRLGTLLVSKDGHLHLTYFGLRVISEKRVAFPRDKNRLFFLKDLVRGRRDRD
jgi:hypothetical protein